MAIADILEFHGWIRERMREPLAIHQGVVASHLPYLEEYIDEVQSCD